MKCPKCGASTRVEKTISGMGRATRQRYCESKLCDATTFQTIEVPTGPADMVNASLIKNIAALEGGFSETADL